MNTDLLKILADSNKDIDNQQLMDYIAGSISQKDLHEVEKSMADSDFVNDAIEGLQQVQNKKNLDTVVEQLNNDLNRKIRQKNIRREKRKLKDQPWIYFSLILLLLLVTVAWFILHRLHNTH